MAEILLPVPGEIGWAGKLNTAIDLVNDRLPEILPDGLVPTGMVNSSPSIQAALDSPLNRVVSLPAGKYLLSTKITVPKGKTLRGAGSGNYNQGAENPSITQLIVAPGLSVGVEVESKGNISDIRISGRIENADDWNLADYPSRGNATVGLHLGSGGGSANATSLVVERFEFGIRAETTAHIDKCFVSMCDIGYDLVGADGWLTHSVAMFNYTAGSKATGAYWRYIGCRFEWNARYGLDSAAESTITGCLFDRNGWAGILCREAQWGHVITGNYFSRNGVGGDGALGRWGFSTPSHPSYVATTPDQSCHIQVDYQRAVAVTGNRFRAGADDADQGANGPYYIISSLTPDFATGGSVAFSGNAGITDDSAWGFNEDMYGPGGGIAGGTDQALIDYLTGGGGGGALTGDSLSVTGTVAGAQGEFVNGASGFALLAYGYVQSNGDVRTPALSPQRTTVGPVNSLAIPVDKGADTGRSGIVVLSAKYWDGACVSEIAFGLNALGASPVATVDNKLGTLVTGATFATGAETNTLTVTFSVECYINYQILYAS